MRLLPLSCLILSLSLGASGAEAAKRIPPPGIEVPADTREELQNGTRDLAGEIAALKKEFAADAKKLAEIPSVEVFHKAVDWALRYGEFFEPKQFDVARGQIAQGMQRAKNLRNGTPWWNEATGLVVRGYRSALDGSVQPYGLVIPADWNPKEDKPRPLHLWCHGRGEKLTELAFIQDRQFNKGEFLPEGAIVLHLYGRFCCANKFAGEMDAFEALRDVLAHYSIDTRRVVVRGFSMGGASAWQFATHHAGKFAAAAPGAGFAETAEFFRVFAPGKTPPPWWEQLLWRWYDSTVYARNLNGLPLVAYSGEIDGQKQAADIMVRYAEKEGISFPHVIGPQTPHKYHPDSKVEIEKFITDALVKGREVVPTSVKFTTYTLIYPSRAWVTVTGMDRQWERADVDAAVDKSDVVVKTSNVSALQLDLATLSQGVRGLKQVRVDGSVVLLDEQIATGQLPLVKAGKEWRIDVAGAAAANGGKRPGRCGPIDHAFMSPFLHVKPTGNALNEAEGIWVKSEMEHALAQWRQVFRGDAPTKDDSAVNESDIKNNNLILWGDPSSNAVLKKIADKLPIKWTKEALKFRSYKLDAGNYVPALIFPNPLNPAKYIVLNSGHTFRERAAANNSDQTPKLPDWAIVDFRTPPDEQWPGLVYDAGFFDEQWR